MRKHLKIFSLILTLMLVIGSIPNVLANEPEPFNIVEARLVTEVLDWGETITAMRIEYSDQIWCGDIEYSLEHTDKMTYKMVTGRDIVNLYVNNSGKKDDIQTQGKYVFINFGLERQDFSAYRDVVLFQPGRGTRNQPPSYYFTQSVPIVSSITGKVAPSRTMSTAATGMTAAKNAALPDLNGTPGIGPGESVREIRTASTEVRVTLDKFRTFQYTSPIGTRINFHLQIPPGYDVPRADNQGAALPMMVHFPNGGDMNYIDDAHNAADRRYLGALYSHPEATYWAADEAQERNPSFVMSLAGTNASNYGTDGLPAANWGNWLVNSQMQRDYIAAIRWVKARFKVDEDRVSAMNLAGSLPATLGTIMSDDVDDFSALIINAYDVYHVFTGGNLAIPPGGTAQTTYLGRMKYAEEQFAKVMNKLSTWQFNGLNDRTGMVAGDTTYAETERDPVTGAPTTYQGRFKGERNLDWAYRMNKAAGKTVVVANDFYTMWNGLETAPTTNQNLIWRENEVKAQEQWDRAKAAGANHLVSIIAPNTLPQTNHWSWNPPSGNLVVHDWMYAQSRAANTAKGFDASILNNLVEADYGPYPGQSPRTPRYPQPGAGTARMVEARLVTEVLDWGETITAIRIEYSEPVLCDAIEHSVEHATRQTYQMASDRDIVNLYVNDSGLKDDYGTQGRYVFINLGLESEDFTSYRDQVVFHTSARIRPRPNPYYLYQAFPVITMSGNVVQPRGITTATGAIRGTLMDTSELPNITQMDVWSTEVRMTIDDFRTFRYTNPVNDSVTKFHLYIPPGYEKKSASLQDIPFVVHFPAGDTAYVDDVLGNADASRQMGTLFTHPDATVWGSAKAQAEQKAFVLTPGPNWNNNYMFIVKALADNLNIDTSKIYAISLAGGSPFMWNTLEANPGFFAAQISTAYDPYHAFNSSFTGTFAEKAKGTEDKFARIMETLPGWYFNGLSDGSGNQADDPLARKKGERMRDLGFVMVERGFKVDVGWGQSGEQMWNGMVRGRKAEAEAIAQINRANASGANHMITNFIPGTVLQTMHWSWNAAYTNAVVRGWLYAQTNPDPVGTANIIAPGAQTYSVTVSSAGTGATGGGSYPQGARVNITAGTPPAGLQFVNWMSTGGVTFDNPNDASTRFTMPGNAVTVTAIFRPILTDGPVASVSAPAFYGSTDTLSYTISLENEIVGISGFVVKFEYDADVLVFAISQSLFPDFSAVIETADNGVYTAMFVKGVQGGVETAPTIKPMLQLNFNVIGYSPDIVGTLASVRVIEMPSNDSIDCILYPAMVVSQYMNYDANGDGVLDERDIAFIAYHYYMVSEGDPLWEVARRFDAKKDGRIDILDILIIASYIKI